VSGAPAVGVRQMTQGDWPDVERIYAAGMLTGNATFDDATPSKEDFFSRRIPELSLVAENDGGILGWAAASPVSGRPDAVWPFRRTLA
jgi:L-amino acid N-acyltransferase YncA